MTDEMYDLLPHQQVEQLKKQVAALQEKQDKSAPPELVNSLTQLTRSLEVMTKLFTQAADNMKEGSGEGKAHADINKKMDEILDQNRAIAEGIVALSDSVNDFLDGQAEQPSVSVQVPPTPQRDPIYDVNIQRPQAPMPPPGPAPRDMPPSFQPNRDMSPGLDIPPRPNLDPKKGLFGKMRK